MIKTIVVLAFLLIILSLGSALLDLLKYHKNQHQSKSIVKALTFRIALSVLLFIFIFIAIATGIYKPEGIGMQIKKQQPSYRLNKNN